MTTTSLGIDLSSSATGLVLLEAQAGGKPEVKFSVTLKLDAKYVGMERWRLLALGLMTEIHSRKPTRIVLENYSLNMKNVASVVPLVELGGIFRLMMNLDGISWMEPRANQVKLFVTGKGNAKKSSMMMHVLKRWGWEAPDEDQADAYGLAAIGLAHCGALSGMTKDMLKVAGSLPLRSV